MAHKALKKMAYAAQGKSRSQPKKKTSLVSKAAVTPFKGVERGDADNLEKVKGKR